MLLKSMPQPSKLLSEGHLCGYASTFGIRDSDNDCVMKGAFRESLKKWQAASGWPKLLWQHQSREPIGVWTYMAEDSHGLFVEGRLNLETQRGFEAWSLIKQGAIGHLSIGFLPKDATIDPVSKARHIHCIDLFEVSLVTFASNQLAQLTAPSMPFAKECKHVSYCTSTWAESVRALASTTVRT